MKSVYMPILLAIAFLASGCRNDEHPHEQDDDEAPTVQSTVWTNGYEVFAEYGIPAAGNAAEFLVHLTNVETFSPEQTPIALNFTHAGENLNVPASPPARPGIHISEVTFPVAGEWNLEVRIKSTTIKLPPVIVYASQEAAKKAGAAEETQHITFLKEQQWNLNFKTEPVEKREVAETMQLGATVTPKPGSLASVIAPVAGSISIPPNQPLLVPGQEVEAGQLLVLLQPAFSEQTASLLQAESEAIRAKAAYELARIQLERTQKLAESDAKSPREVQEAEFAFKQAEAAYQAAKALQSTYKKLTGGGATSTNFSTIELRAPISGVISHAAPNLGTAVTAAQLLFTIMESRKVWIEAQLPQTYIDALAKEPIATVNSRPLQFVYRGLQIDPATRSVPIVFAADNTSKQFLLGQTVALQIETKTATNSITVPVAAIVEEEGRPVVFVQVGGEAFEKRNVEIGIRGEAYVQILSGLAAGERVVSQGAYAVRLASVSSTIPEHLHTH